MTERSSTPKPHSGGKRRARAFADRSSSIWPKFSWWPVASEFELSDGENQGGRCNWLGFERDLKRPVRESWFFRTSGAEGIAADRAAECGTRQEFGNRPDATLGREPCTSCRHLRDAASACERSENRSDFIVPLPRNKRRWYGVSS